MNSDSSTFPPSDTPLQAAFNLSREIGRLPARTPLKDILHRLTFLKSGDAPGMVSVGYFGRESNSQLYGYLIVDQEHKRYAEQSMPVEVHPLPDDVRSALRRAHEEIRRLNLACVGPILQKYPDWGTLLDPYGFRIPLNPNEAPSLEESSFLNSSANQLVVDAFASHFSMPVLFDIDPVPGADYLAHEVKRLEAALDYWGAMTSPPYVEVFKKRYPPGVPIRRYFRVVEALVCLRASLKVLNQMIFQKLKEDKLPYLSDNEIFAVPMISFHDTGRGMSILYQPVGFEHYFSGGELIIVQEIDNYTMIDQKLYQVSAASKSAMLSDFSEDGSMGYCHLRPIDRFLCPFSVMWGGIYDETKPSSFF